MKKNVLLSALAMASAPLASYATADLSEQIKNTTTDWTGASDLSIDKGVITSPNGTAVSQTIKLYKGDYTLSWGSNTNATVKVNGKALSSGGKFTVSDETADVVIRIESTDGVRSFTIGGFTLTLDFDFKKNVYAPLIALYNTASASIVSTTDEKVSDTAAEFINGKASNLISEGATLVTEISKFNSDDVAYDIYVSYKLYNRLEGTDIYNKVDDFKYRAEAQGANAKAYLAANEAIYTQEQALNDATESIKSLTLVADVSNIKDNYPTTEKKQTYVTNKTADTKTAATDYINSYRAEADAALKGDKAVDVCTSDKNASYTTEASKLVDAYTQAINVAATNYDKYAEVANMIAALRTTWTTANKTILGLLENKTSTAADLYYNLYQKALGELNEVDNLIDDIENTKNGKGTPVDNATAYYDSNKQKLNGCESQITELQTKWTDKANAVKKAYAGADAAIADAQKALTAIQDDLKAAEITDYDKDVTEIQTLIDNLTTTVTDKTKASGKSEDDIDMYYGDGTTGQFSTDLGTITTKIAELKTNTNAALLNYNAWQKVQEAVSDLKFNEVKKRVQALKSKDSQYTVGSKYATTETSIQTSIEALLDEAKAAYKAKTCATYVTVGEDGYKIIGLAETTQSKVTEISAAINSYETMATEGRDAYNGIATAVERYNGAIAALKKEVDDTNVTVYSNGEATSDTYGSKIKALESKVTKITTELLAARAKEDVEHHDALVTLETTATNEENASIVTEANTLKGTYASDKDQYETDKATKAFEQTIKQAENLVSGVKIYEYTKEEVGTAYDDLQEEETELRTLLAVEKAKIDKAKTSGDISEASSMLTEVTNDISKIKVRVDAFNKKVKDAKAKVTANATVYDEAMDYIAKIEDLLNGNAAQEIVGVKDLNKDESRDEEFAEKVTTLTAKIETQKTAIAADKDAETLADETDEGNVTKDTYTKTIKPALDEILKEVNATRDAAVASTNNWKAYQEVLAEINLTKVEKAVIAARTAVDEMAGNDAAKAYYEKLVKGYEDELEDIKADNKTAYNAPKRNSVDVKTGLIDRIDVLKENANKVAQDIADNKSYYEDQSKRAGNIESSYDEIYNSISKGDLTTKAKEYLERLTQEKAELDKAKKNIEDAYKAGESKDKDTEIQGSLNSIETAIKGIKEEQSDNYDKYVTADNNTRWENFNRAVDEAKKEFKSAVETINAFSALKNEAFVDLIAPNVAEASTTINGILTDLNSLWDKAHEEYLAAESPALYDQAESNKVEAEGYWNKINTTLTVLDEAVNAKAKPYFQIEYDKRYSSYEDAVKELQDAEMQTIIYHEMFYKEAYETFAFADVKDILDRASRALDEKFLATKIDGFLVEFDGIKDMIAADQEKVAVNDWAKLVGELDAQTEQELTDLKNFEYITGEVGEDYKSNTIELYEELVAKTITTAKAEYAKIADDQHYAKLPSVKALLKEFYESTLYADAQTKARKNEQNLAAYDDLMKRIAEVQAELDDANAFVDGYVISDDCGGDGYQSTLDGYKQTVENGKKNGGLVNDKQTMLVNLTTLSENIAGMYAEATENELLRIELELDNLRKDQNNAAKAVEGDKEKAAAVKSYDVNITKVTDTFKALTTDDDFDTMEDSEKQTKLVAIEKEIARLRAELTVFYSSTLGATTYQELTDAINEVKSDCTAETTALDGCSDQVKTEYGDELAELTQAINDLQGDLDGYNSENTVLFYKDKVSDETAELANKLKDLTAKIAAAQKPYTDNENAYKKLTAQIEDELQKALDDLKTKVGTFKFTFPLDEESNTAIGSNYIKLFTDIQKAIDDQKDAIENAYEAGKEAAIGEVETAGGLTSTRELEAASNIKSNITNLDKDVTYWERYNNIWNSNSKGEPSLRDLYNDVSATLNSSTNKYMTGVKEQLTEELDAIRKGIMAVAEYNDYAANRGYVTKDIYGEELKNENGKTEVKSLDYLKEADPAVQTRIAELATRLTELNTDAEEEAYKLGDVNRDKYIMVDDYQSIVAIAIGRDTADEGTLKFAAADVNEDGAINVGDATAVMNLVLGKTTVSNVSAVRRAALAPTTTEDVIELTADDNNGMKRIAVSLKNTRAYVGMQLDVTLPVGVTLVGEELGSRAEGHKLYSNDLANGTHRILVSSMENAEFNANDDAVIYLEVSGQLANRITVSNVLLSDGAGKVYKAIGGGTGGTTGISGVSENLTLKEKIYSVGGQMMQTIKKGINIIRNSDGSTKKIMGK